MINVTAVLSEIVIYVRSTDLLLNKWLSKDPYSPVQTVDNTFRLTILSKDCDLFRKQTNSVVAIQTVDLSLNLKPYKFAHLSKSCPIFDW